MKLNFHTINTALPESSRRERADSRYTALKVIGLFLLVVLALFATLGNQPKLVIRTHDGHNDNATTGSFQVSEHHDDGHHDDHLPVDDHDDTEHSHHHHHVEISPSLIIAVETFGEKNVFRSVSALSVSIPDEICPPSPFSEIVKPPQVA
ncbi:MAG: hypothetical protein ABJM75_02780 [Luteolibacter sp.]